MLFAYNVQLPLLTVLLAKQVIISLVQLVYNAPIVVLHVMQLLVRAHSVQIQLLELLVRLAYAKMVIMMMELMHYALHVVTPVPNVRGRPLIVLNVLQELTEGLLQVALVIQVM